MVVNSMSYATYERYKDSGVDWLGEIPSDWELISLNRVSKVKSISNHPNERLLSVYLEKGVIPFEDVSEKRTNGTSDNLDKYQLVDIGDFVLNNQQAWRGSVGVSNYRGIISPAYIILEISDKLNSKFANYFFRSEKMIYQYVIHSKGVGTIQRNLYWQSFKNSLCWIPSLEEQTKIANFLDQKTAQIDQAIALKQQQIEKLGEYKQIVIQNAVTKGLNPNAPMKDSGVEWIGDIPEHWDVKKLKNVSKVVLGKMICNEKTGNMKLKPYLKSKNIQWLKVDLNSVDEMWFTPKEMEMYRLKQGDLVLSEGGEVGKTCIWNNDLEECYIQNSAHKVTFENKQNSKYYLYLFFSLGKQGQFEKIVNRVSIGHLTKEKLINTFVFCPPLSEQNEIVKLIDDYLIKFNEIINCYETQIDRLKEYKNILINQAVTGKIKI